MFSCYGSLMLHASGTPAGRSLRGYAIILYSTVSCKLIVYHTNNKNNNNNNSNNNTNSNSNSNDSNIHYYYYNDSKHSNTQYYIIQNIIYTTSRRIYDDVW